MGGEFMLKYIRTGIPLEHDEFATDEFNGEEDEFWSYNFSGFAWSKGRLLRGAIRYLEHLHTSAKEKAATPDGAKQFFLDAGIKAIADTKDDPTAVKGAEVVIRGALQILKEWKREQHGSEWKAKERSNEAGSMFTAFMHGLPFPGPGSNIEEVLDMPYYRQKIAITPGCPIELERVDMRGLFLLLRMGDHDEMIYSDAAQMIASTVDRLLPHALEMEDKSGDFEEFAIGFSQFLKKCTPCMYIDGVPA